MPSDYRRKTDALPTCMNCGSVLYGPYCSQCGQRSAETFTFDGLRGRLRRRLRDRDFAVVRTVVGLTVDPGSLARKYLQGQRRPFVQPGIYALCSATLLAAVALWSGADLSASGTPWSGLPGEGPVRGVLAFCSFAAFAVLLPVAWLQRLLHRQERWNVAETYVFGLFVFGHLGIYQAVFALLGAFASTVGLAALGAALVLVLAHALAGFYDRSLPASVPAALVLAVAEVAGVFVAGSLVRMAGWG
ncbi:MAG: DUF3667 domain-containing protein [Acidobacteriota bacterium]